MPTRDRDKATIVELLKSDDPLIKSYAEFLYREDYSLYTAKQWGISPSEIDISALERVPVLFTYYDGYFDDEFQYMPQNGFTEFFNNMVTHKNIEITGQQHLLFSQKTAKNRHLRTAAIYWGKL